MTRLRAAAMLAAVVLAGCGGSSGSSGVPPKAYVKSICTALGGWKQQVQSAGQALQSSGVATASPANAKIQYVGFVSSLLRATRQAATALDAAGTPSVKDGATIASGLSGAFHRSGQALATALSRAQAIPTTSTSAFETAANEVTTEIRSALSNIAGVTPRSSPQLRAAALTEPSCRALAG